jgi:hypothetical protein
MIVKVWNIIYTGSNWRLMSSNRRHIAVGNLITVLIIIMSKNSVVISVTNAWKMKPNMHNCKAILGLSFRRHIHYPVFAVVMDQINWSIVVAAYFVAVKILCVMTRDSEALSKVASRLKCILTVIQLLITLQGSCLSEKCPHQLTLEMRVHLAFVAFLSSSVTHL